MRKNILIIGGRPDPVIKSCDVVYFINGSIEHQHKLHGNPKVVHIISKSALLKAIREKKGEKLSIRQKRLACYDNAKPDKTIFVDTGDEDLIINSLSDRGYQFGEQETISLKEKENFIFQVTGSYPPFGTVLLAKYNMKKAYKRYKQLIRVYLKKRKGDDVEWPSDFMPSNGVFALLHAITVFGKEYQYLLSGISLEPYNYGYKIDGETHFKKGLRLHYVADKKILKSLNNIEISSDDDSVLRQTTFNKIIS